MKYLDLFTGYGGFSLGIQQAYEDNRKSRPSSNGKPTASGYLSDPESGNKKGRQRAACIGFSEIDKYAISVYQKHFPEHKNYGDITKINPDTLPDFDLLTGGFPCQAFSIAGKRRGFDDTRGTLFFDIARILKVKKPRNFVLENVKGLLSHDNGRTFKTIITTLTELGYCVEWQVINAKDYVPQNRERVFIVGHLGGLPERKVFPLGEDDGKTTDVQGHVSNTLTARYFGAEATGTYIEEGKLDAQIRQLNNPTHSNNRIYGQEGVSPSLNTMQGGNRQPKITIPVLTPDRPEKRQNGRRFKEDGEPSFTLTSQDKHGIYNGMRIRRLTPTECERLMGLPDGWTARGKKGEEEVEISDSQRYKLCGNGVVVNVVEAVVRKLYGLPEKRTEITN